MNILYFEDEKVWRDKYLPILEGLNHDIVVFKDEREALKSIRNGLCERPDIAILDIRNQLRKKSKAGFEICTVLRKQWPSTIIIFLTTYGYSEATHLEAIEIGGNYYVAKDQDYAGLFLIKTLKNAELFLEIITRDADIYNVGDLTINQKAKSATFLQIPLKLQLMSFAILDNLALNRNKLQTYEEIRLAAGIKEPSLNDLEVEDITKPDYEKAKKKKINANINVQIRLIRAEIGEAIKKAQNRLHGSVIDNDDTINLQVNSIIVNVFNKGYRYVPN